MGFNPKQAYPCDVCGTTSCYCSCVLGLTLCSDCYTSLLLWLLREVKAFRHEQTCW